MDLKQLIYFLEICKAGSFSAATNHLYISQQGLSMSIARLEEELGCKLFNRNTRKLTLTPDGEYLQAEASEIVAKVEECQSHFRQLYHMPQVIHVAINEGTISLLPAKVLSLFYKQESPYQVELHYKLGLDSEELIDQGVCSLGFICGPIATNKYHSRLLARREYTYIVNVENPLASLDYLTLEDLDGQSIIMPGKKSKIFNQFSALCAEKGIQIHYPMETAASSYTNQNVIFNLVKKDANCIGQTLDFFTENINNSHIKVMKLKGLYLPWELYITWSKDRMLTKVEQDFMELIIDSFHESENSGERI